MTAPLRSEFDILNAQVDELRKSLEEHDLNHRALLSRNNEMMELILQLREDNRHLSATRQENSSLTIESKMSKENQDKTMQKIEVTLLSKCEQGKVTLRCSPYFRVGEK